MTARTSRTCRRPGRWLSACLLALLGAACSSTEGLRPEERARIEALPDLAIAVEDLTCLLRSDEGRRWAVLRGPGGVEYAAVAYDPDTGLEDFSTQRFLGLDERQLLQRVGTGDASPLRARSCLRAACLWVPTASHFVGSRSLDGALQRRVPDATDIDAQVLNRQSQLLAYLVGRVAPPDRTKNPEIALVWTEDHCTLSPDFAFTTLCCREHDDCYAEGGDAADREACDEAFCACIEANGYPMLARVYYAAVRAFGARRFGAD